ncbi:hypothetical protein HNQ80_000425 [Anaerosolibacter carboniphilus]|uniref:SLH domain-containing protein n=1 Tax=Anaerosolibacter carboniphilus TaxID=1417629 RepID=A0A841KVY9_9FIRM|nr:S-layer homology domain-containing protein [Anaerosolibacter carboniphilus]MBB6214345.1 hypothetical protein [Anaerosolibacter carboniphilus]
MYRRFRYYGLLLLTAVICLSMGMMVASQIFADDNVPTIVVQEGGATTVAPIFQSDGSNGVGPWYPGGPSKNSVLRISNQYGRKVTLNKLGMDIALEKGNETIGINSQNALDYMKYMKIKVDYKSPFAKIMEGSIYDGDFRGFKEGAPCTIDMANGKDLDLVYEVWMDEEAQINIAGINGKIDFTVGVESLDPDDDDDGDDRDRDREDKEPLVEEPEVIIPDIGAHWAHDCIVTLVEHGIVTGYPDGSIQPDNKITRAETAVLIGKALQLQEQDNFFSGYIDPIPKWARGYIIATTESDIFKGYPGRIFKPGQNISREEMATVLMRAFEKKGNAENILAFTDKDTISDWALEYIQSGVSNEIIVGYPDNTFKPQDDITRAEAFVMICKLLGYHTQHTSNE